ncbi:tetratricopeptide repeat-containing sensor histidine kinase [Arsenicibacter rosenii]|uniref:Oxygen sensor histidine kinase NreB n=1 Tax=Arsenicibacter rosenii TaxID=1750698 RepID=A0A1S2VNJ3_9BACT|nr:tetratricopeptide repeat-containing sensor histidine kinase [Arsenicibacter rosenii]OIN60352.1 histidine kinase [Arsenicibacter rosenii]
MQRLLLFCSWLLLPALGMAQRTRLPEVDFDRRNDAGYMDSLRLLGHQHLTFTKKLPRTLKNDTLHLEGLRFLAIVFKQLRGNVQDSSYYYAGLLVNEARQRRNNLYMVRGLMLEEFYVRSVRKDYANALILNQKAADLCVSLRPETSPLWQVRMNMGDIYLLLKDYRQAIKSYEESLALLPLNKILSRRNQRLLMGQAEGQIGEAMVALKRYEEAIHKFEHVREIAREVNSQLNLVYANERLGDFMLNRQIAGEAIPYYKEALQTWIKLNDLAGQTSVWARLSECYSMTGETKLAIDYGEKALQAAQKLRNDPLRQMASIALYKSYRAAGLVDKALYMYESFVAIRDSLNDRKRVDELLALQRKYDVEKVQAEAEKRQLIHRQQLLEMRQRADVEKVRTEAERRQLAAQAREAQLQRKIETEKLRSGALRKQVEQQSRIESLSMDIQRQTLMRTFLIAGLVMLLGFVATLYRNNLLVRRQRQQIHALNVGLEDKVRDRTIELELANEQLRAKNREIEDALLRGQTLERKRVAADLHDNLGGTLSAIKLSLSALNPGKLSEREQLVYQNLVTMTREAYAEVRNLSHNLQPDELEQEGLGRALCRLIQKLNNTQLTQFTLAAGELPRLNKTTEFHLYSICLELANNILKHSRATEAHIQFKRVNNDLNMIVRDNGRGMESVVHQHDNHMQMVGMGLRNIQARTEAMKGRLEVYSEVGEGTTFFFVLPLTKDTVHV